MQWPRLFSKAENQTARAVFVVRIIFDDLAILYCLDQFVNANATYNALIDSVFREFKQPKCKFRTNLLDHLLKIILRIVQYLTHSVIAR